MNPIYLIFFCLFSCTNIFIEDQKYNSLAFKGGSWIEFPVADSMKIDRNDFTLQFWVSGGTIDTNEAPALFSFIDPEDNVKLALYRDPAIKNSITLNINSKITRMIDLDINWSKANDFHLISILFSDQYGTKIFVNDFLKYQSDEKINILNNKFIVGALANENLTILENFWYGYIDEIRLWNTYLSDSTITFHYNHPNKIGDYYKYTYYDSLIGLWRFNLATPTVEIFDESNFNNNGEIYNLKGFSVKPSKIGAL